MDLPLKVELPRLSHADLLRVVLPFIPGFVLAVDASLAGFRPLAWEASLGLGYKSAIAVYLLFIYISGVALSLIIDVLSATVTIRLWPPKKTISYSDPYWRHLAGEYIGNSRNPICMKLSSAEIAEYLKHICDRDATARDALEKLKKQSKEMDDLFKEAQAGLDKLPEGEKKVDFYNQLMKLKTSREEKLAELTRKEFELLQDYAWIQIGVALSLVETIDYPYQGYETVMTSLQTSAIIQLAFSFIVSGERNYAIIICAGAMFIVSSQAVLHVKKLARIYGELNIKPIASLLKNIHNTEK